MRPDSRDMRHRARHRGELRNSQAARLLPARSGGFHRPALRLLVPWRLTAGVAAERLRVPLLHFETRVSGRRAPSRPSCRCHPRLKCRPSGRHLSSFILTTSRAVSLRAGPNFCSEASPCVQGHPVCLTGPAGNSLSLKNLTAGGFVYGNAKADQPHTWFCPQDIPAMALPNGARDCGSGVSPLGAFRAAPAALTTRSLELLS